MESQSTRTTLADFITERKDELVANWGRLLMSPDSSHYRNRDPAEVAAWTRAGMDALMARLRGGVWAPLETRAKHISRQHGRQGFAIGEVAGGLVTPFTARFAEEMVRETRKPPARPREPVSIDDMASYCGTRLPAQQAPGGWWLLGGRCLEQLLGGGRVRVRAQDLLGQHRGFGAV